MALYLSISLLAVLLATPNEHAVENRWEVGVALLLTGLGLMAAHQVAFRMSTRLVSGGKIDDQAAEELRAQWVGGGAVALLAATPILVLGGELGLFLAELALVLVFCSVGYWTVRAAGGSRTRALLYDAGAVVVLVALLALKLAVGH